MKRWLENNKIYFETITALALSVMSIIVTFAQLNSANVQNEIAKQAVLPHFIIKAQPNRYYNNREELIITNKGAIIHEFKCSSIAIVHVIMSENNLKKEKVYTYLVNDYFDIIEKPEDGKGLLYKSFAHQNKITFTNFNFEFRRLCREKELYGKMELKRFVYIEYKDQIEKTHKEYYFVPEEFGGIKLDNKEGARIFKDTKKYKSINVNQIKPEDLLNNE